MTTEVEFDEPTHVYKVAGVVVPGVTAILSDLSVMKRLDPAILAEGRERGHLVHMAVHYWNDGQLDETSVDERVEPYLRAWKRFCADFRYEPEVNEMIGYSEKWNFAGTFDTIGTWRQLRKRPRVLIDVKSGLPDPCHGPQTAAYVQLARENDLVDRTEMPQRAVVRLQPNGHYMVDPMMDPGDWATFVAALQCHNFKSRHGIL